MARNKFWDSQEKAKAREFIPIYYKKFIGIDKLAEDRQYWTLANYQPRNYKFCETNQMVDTLGFCEREQLVLVDMDGHIVNHNIKHQPECMSIKGEWTKVITSNLDFFNPGCIYLDTQNTVNGKEIIRLAEFTMDYCPPETLLVINTSLNNAHSGERFSKELLITRLDDVLPNAQKNLWEKEVEVLSYNMTGKTDMGMYFLFKRGEDAKQA